MRIPRRTGLPIPPDDLRFMREDPDKFLRVGDRLVDDLRGLAGMGARSTVLDVGCGYGRVAHALRRARRFHGRYIGIDILPNHIAWCSDNLGNRRFRFHHLDVRNDRYNATGRLAATEVELPVRDASVDVALATSLFTHMWPEDVAHYLGEIAGALRPGGRAYLTFFLLDETWHQLHDSGPQGSVVMHHRHDPDVRYMSEDDPLHAIGYSPAWVARQASRVGLTQTMVQLGAWCGRRDGRGFQDALVFRREE